MAFFASSVDEKHNVYTMPSEIKDAGIGLYTEVKVPKGKVIMPYEGEVLTEEEFDRRYPHGGSEYVLDIGNKIIDAVNPRLSNLARYINHSKPFNVQFTKHGNIKAIKNIAAHTELRIDYGPKYWKNRSPPAKAPTKPRVKQPAKAATKAKPTAAKKRERALGIY